MLYRLSYKFYRNLDRIELSTHYFYMRFSEVIYFFT
nr:MAG TPA: hypothetical protein [Caudoviricetes sp.]